MNGELAFSHAKVPGVRTHQTPNSLQMSVNMTKTKGEFSMTSLCDLHNNYMDGVDKSDMLGLVSHQI